MASVAPDNFLRTSLEKGSMTRFAILTGLAFTSIPCALAQTPDTRPTSVTIQTPENWTRTALRNGMDRYQPLEAATNGRPGSVNRTVLTLTDAETRNLTQDTIDASLARTAPKFLNGL